MEQPDVFQQIEDLDNSKSVRELLNKLKPILRELAYYSMSGDGAILEAKEKWHTIFTNQIREEVGAGQNNSISQQISAYDAPMFNQSRAQNAKKTSIPQSLSTIMDGSHISFRTN